jgi:hypothetical protein
MPRERIETETDKRHREPEATEDEKRQAKRLRKGARPKDHRDEGGQG